MPGLTAAETTLAARTGAFLTLAKIPFSGSSPIGAFQDGISVALGYCGTPPTDPSIVTNSDMARLANANWYKFLDVAELRVLETAAAALINRAQGRRWVDYSENTDLASFHQYLDGKRKAVRLKWGYGSAPLTTGVIDLNFAARCDEF